MLPSFSFPPLECCFGTSSIQAEKFPSRSESPRISDAGDQSGGQCRTDAGDRIEPLARLIGSVPGHDPAVELQDLRFQPPQLDTQGGETRPGKLGHALVTSIRDDIKQLYNTLARHRGYDPELGQMGADGVDYRGLLADKEMARAMQHQAALLLGRLGLDKLHVGPGDRFADGLGVSGIVLLALDVWLHIGRRHQAYGMAERLEFA